MDYIEHPAMVASYVQALPDFVSADAKAQQAALATAWLHDVIDDTPETTGTLSEAAIGKDVIRAVLALTRQEDVPSSVYYAHIRTVPLALMVKTADVASNLAPERVARLDPETREQLAATYNHALQELGIDRSVITTLHLDRSGAAENSTGL